MRKQTALDGQVADMGKILPSLAGTKKENVGYEISKGKGRGEKREISSNNRTITAIDRRRVPKNKPHTLKKRPPPPPPQNAKAGASWTLLRKGKGKRLLITVRKKKKKIWR